MQYVEISIEDLIVNPENDRHGPTVSEDTAIAWLFDNKAKDMKVLATRIAAVGRIYDSPLVVPYEGKFLVKDGNRRVACIKLIHNPLRAPQKYRNFFSDLKNECEKTLSKVVVCQLENDISMADEIIGLRHNGKQNGAGQLPWGPREKATHANRVSGKSEYEWPQHVEKFLEANGYSDEAASIKRSTLDRVLKAKKRREKLGIGRDAEGNLISTIQGYDILPLLLRFAQDMRDSKLTLKETLVSKDIDDYLAKLQSEGLLPIVKKPDAPSPAPKKPPRPQPNPPPAPAPKPLMRDTLIPRDVNYDFSWVQGQTKIQTAWSQLQHELNFEKHKFSIALVFRTILEMTAKNYRDKNSLPDLGALAKNLLAVLKSLRERELIEAKVFSDVERIFHDTRSAISIENLHRVVHSTSQIPTKDDLVSMWDCLDPFFVACLKSVQHPKR